MRDIAESSGLRSSRSKIGMIAASTSALAASEIACFSGSLDRRGRDLRREQRGILADELDVLPAVTNQTLAAGTQATGDSRRA
jgi:hypothetical protein